MKTGGAPLKRAQPGTSLGCGNLLLIPALLFCATLLLPLASFLSASASTPHSVPYPLHSVLAADYSAELSSMWIPGLNPRVIAEVIKDQESYANPTRIAEVDGRLQSPVPTVTPRFPAESNQPSQPAPTRTPTPTSLPKRSATATVTVTVTLISGQFPTLTAQPTYRPSPAATPQPKPTREKPTQPPATKPPTSEPAPTQPPDPYPRPNPGPVPGPEPTRPPYP